MPNPKNTDPGTELLPATSADLVRALFDGSLSIPERDPEEVAMEIALRIASATSVEDVLSPQELVSSRDLLDTPLRVHSVKLQKSDFTQGMRFYAVIEADDMKANEAVTFSCGGTNVVTQLIKLQELGAMPIEVMLVESGRPTANGYRPLWLQPIGGTKARRSKGGTEPGSVKMEDGSTF